MSFREGFNPSAFPDWAWFLEQWKKTLAELDEIGEDNERRLQAAETLANDLKSFVNNYFDNLNVQQEVNAKIDSMVASGTFLQITEPTIAVNVTDWLIDNITQPEGVVIDTSLTVSGACADAKATGDRLLVAERTTNDFNSLFTLPVTWLENYYIRPGNGLLVPIAESSTEKHWASNPVPVTEGAKIVTQYYGAKGTVGYAFYDARGEQITGYGLDEGVGQIRLITVPKGATSFRYTKETKAHNYDWNLYYNLTPDGINNFVQMRDDVLPPGVNDFNDIPSGTIYKIISGGDRANAPVPEFRGLVVTLNATRATENVKLQIATHRDSKIFMRAMWTSWGEWKEVRDSKNGNIMAMYDNITCIGDSLTYGQVYTQRTPTSESRQAYRPYPEILAKMCGAEYEILANPGDTAAETWRRWESRIVSKENNINIVYLGTNGGLTDTIESDCPTSGEYANTNTGCYGKILKKISDLNQKAILVKVYDSSADIDTTNLVIEKFGVKFTFPVVDAIELGTVYRMCPRNHNETGGLHYNDLGYSVFASRLFEAVNNLNDTMMERLIPKL